MKRSLRKPGEQADNSKGERQILQVGPNIGGTPFYVFNYAAGSISNGSGGGLAYEFTWNG